MPQGEKADNGAQEERKGSNLDVEMDYVNYQQYEEDGGVWLVACREPETDVEETLGGELGVGDELGFAEDVHFRDDRTGKPLDAAKVRAAREEELKELDRRVWVEADVSECWEKKGRGPIGVRWGVVDKGFGVHRSRLGTSSRGAKSTTGKGSSLRRHPWSW